MDKIKGLDNLLIEGFNEGVYPGFCYCLVTKDNTYFNHYGYKNTHITKEENDISTLYDMASCTKVIVTTTLIMKLLEKGKIRLYDDVSKYLPRFIHKDITIWDLLTHTSGLPSGLGKHGKTREETLDLIYNLDLKFPKHSDIIYSDIGFILLGFIIEKIYDLTLDKVSDLEIFTPLEMGNSRYNPQDKSSCAATELRDDNYYRGLIRGVVHDENAYLLGGVAGHAGLFSNVLDISKFIKMILDNGVYKDKQFLSLATIDLLFTPQVKKTKGVSLDVTTRGLGYIVKGDYCAAGDLASNETIHHTGFTGTNIFIDRINKIGFSLLSNRVHPTRNNGLIIPFRGKIGNYIIANFGGRNEK